MLLTSCKHSTCTDLGFYMNSIASQLDDLRQSVYLNLYTEILVLSKYTAAKTGSSVASYLHSLNSTQHHAWQHTCWLNDLSGTHHRDTEAVTSDSVVHLWELCSERHRWCWEPRLSSFSFCSHPDCGEINGKKKSVEYKEDTGDTV